MSSTEPRPAAPEPSRPRRDTTPTARRVSLFSAPAAPVERDRTEATPVRPVRVGAASAATVLLPSADPLVEQDYDEDGLLEELEAEEAAAYDDQPDDGAPVEEENPRGRLRARKVRRIVRYVSPWSVLKVSLLFSFCLWLIFVVASVIIWQVAVASGGIENVEKFLAKVFAENSFSIDGRQVLRSSAVAGVILVFAGTGFTTLMSLLFNVICDITGGIRFTVLELEDTTRGRRR